TALPRRRHHVVPHGQAAQQVRGVAPHVGTLPQPREHQTQDHGEGDRPQQRPADAQDASAVAGAQVVADQRQPEEATLPDRTAVPPPAGFPRERGPVGRRAGYCPAAARVNAIWVSAFAQKADLDSFHTARLPCTLPVRSRPGGPSAMSRTPKLPLYHRRKRPRVSVILIDWGVRESFHSIHYLNTQTADREDYELVWVEFYDRQPHALHEMASRRAGRGPALDKWAVLGYPDHYCFHKHRMYNVGILLAGGDICVICDSDAVFPPDFIEKIIRAFEETPRPVVHLDEVRNTSRDYYPFNYPSIEQILGPGCINWAGTTTLGLNDSPAMLHHPNYRASLPPPPNT